MDLIGLDHPLLARQRNTFDVDNIRAYALRIRKYLGDGDTILDIGCGFGFVDAAIAELVDTRFVLLDKTGNETHETFSPTGYAHNDLEITRAVASGLNASVYDVAAYGWNDPVDVVISTLSWGWHYPLSLYMDQVERKKPRAIIVDLREAQKIKGFDVVDSFRMNRKETTFVYVRNSVGQA